MNRNTETLAGLYPRLDSRPSANPEQLVQYTKAMTLSEPQPGKDNEFKKRVMVREGGKKIPHAATFEMCTRSDATRFDLDEKMPDLWIAQTPNYMACRYFKQGSFEKPLAQFYQFNHTEMTYKLKQWQHENDHALKKLAGLMKSIIREVKERNGPCVVSYSGNLKAPLIIREFGPDESYPSPSLKMKTLFSKRGNA